MRTSAPTRASVAAFLRGRATLWRESRCLSRANVKRPAFAAPPIRASTITSCVHTGRVEGRCDLGHRAVAWPGEAVISSLTAHALLQIVQRDNAETDELRAGNAWQSSGAGSGPAGGCSWAIASAAVRERRDRRRHARGCVREWTSADRRASQIGPSSQIRLAKERERRARSWTFLLSLRLRRLLYWSSSLATCGGRLGRQHRSHPVAARWSHGCPAAASHWKDDFARVFGQRKSEVGQRRPPAARFGRSWSPGVFAGMHGQGAPSGMGFDRKVMALRLPGRPGRQRESWAWTRRRSSLGLNGFVT